MPCVSCDVMETSGDLMDESWRRNPNWSKPIPRPHVARIPPGYIDTNRKMRQPDFPGPRPCSSFTENYLGAAGVREHDRKLRDGRNTSYAVSPLACQASVPHPGHEITAGTSNLSCRRVNHTAKCQSRMDSAKCRRRRKSHSHRESSRVCNARSS